MKYCFLIHWGVPQYGHSQSEKMLGVGDKYHSREKLKNILVRKPGRKSYCFSQFLAKISSSRISYYFQLLKLVVVEFPTIFSF